MNTRGRLRDAATLAMVACAVLLTAMVARREFGAATPPPRLSGPRVGVQNDWMRFASDGQVLGPADARVTIVEFSDYQCPFCRQFEGYRDSLIGLGASIRVVYRHFPLPRHPHAMAAAIASECAASQGRFQQMHSALFARSDSLGRIPWWRIAQDAGVEDSIRFADCLASSAPRSRIASDSAAGHAMRLRGTPTLLIRDIRVDGLPSFDSLRAYVERAAAKQAADARSR